MYEIVLRLIFLTINLPKYTAIIDKITSAEITPKKTINELYFVANNPEAICVLSPISDIKTIPNPDRNGFFKSYLASFSLLLIRVIIPKMIKTNPEIIFIYVIEIIFLM